MNKKPPFRHRVRVQPIAAMELYRSLPQPTQLLPNEAAQYRRAYYVALWYTAAGHGYGIPNAYGGRTIPYSYCIGIVPMGVN